MAKKKRITKRGYVEYETFIGADGVPVAVHVESFMCYTGCTIHNPTDPNKRWPLHWRGDLKMFERVCPCGTGHPDLDSLNYIRQQKGDEAASAAAVHGCCGGCGAGCPTEAYRNGLATGKAYLEERERTKKKREQKV